MDNCQIVLTGTKTILMNAFLRVLFMYWISYTFCFVFALFCVFADNWKIGAAMPLSWSWLVSIYTPRQRCYDINYTILCIAYASSVCAFLIQANGALWYAVECRHVSVYERSLYVYSCIPWCLAFCSNRSTESYSEPCTHTHTHPREQPERRS